MWLANLVFFCKKLRKKDLFVHVLKDEKLRRDKKDK